ncbi:MAG: hypothetical protein A2286_06780 [Gammaproteobacteria bacterium RIFOXYA12_FULL_61_12]|nr:MAG: hypothetical protein A2286_06780 [Gammaproteobacteria bacterium RIFOXYA12_FULL_61_12]
MTQNTVKPRQHPDLVHRLGPPLGVGEEQGEVVVGEAMQPVALAVDVDPRLVGVGALGLRQRVLHPGLEPLQPLIGLDIEALQRADADRHGHLLLQLIPNTVIGQQLELR